ncbi:hypothetical protein CONLIGDRAFT_392739 [Coniochaeta ligniaria NRRL 30616]|uniref:Zn(2)-C6 fungal-type domain-containing protein n=1 Tax=Coniochaeta ligniaria NRRL 30616 TaxID=1408157 RepID=A0A1J7IN56_9PEZI|nr:hypothetical protein CONLIGDRAFT_392739 [Coniochaeta ligniaria NRRL 30616]
MDSGSLLLYRKRHVKCDEAKPSCSRCIKWQGFCDGYDSRTPKSESGSASPSEPSLSFAGGSPSSAPTPCSEQNALTLLEPASNADIFSSDWGQLYFDQWLTLAHNLGGGWFEAKLFTQTIPQVGQDEPAVRYAAMAVGALAHARAGTTSTALMMDSNHYKSALRFYGRALRLLRQQEDLNKDSALRAAIFCCLLFIAFEFLHGNLHAALKHTNYGLMIVEQFLRSRKSDTDREGAGVWRLPPPTSSYVEVEYSDKSPAPLVLEDEVLQIFQRLDHQSWSMAILNPARLPPPIWYRASAKHQGDEIPDKFDDLDEARRWWDLVQHWVLHFSRTAADKLAAMMAAHPDAAEDLDISDVDGLGELQNEHLEILKRWNAAFSPLYTSARANTKTDIGAYYRAVSLRLQYLASWTGVRAVSFSRYDAISSLTPDFREIVRLSAILLPEQHNNGGESEVFTIDNGPTMALFVVAVKCRDSAVRDEALCLLKKYPRRDGLWDSRAFAVIAEVNSGLEDMNQTDGDLGEQWRRLRKREVIFDERLQECTAKYYVKDEEGTWQLISKNIRW